MVPLAVTFGLTEELRAGRPGLQVTKLTTDVMINKDTSVRQSSVCRVAEFSPSPVDYKVEVCLDTRPQLRSR